MYKVLLADDEKVICEGLKALIDWNGLGYEICGAARNGIELLELTGKYKPDLIISDIKMPKMSGLEAIAELRRSGYDMDILLLTGYAEFEYARGALEQGSCGYLMKPVDDDELTRQLKRIAVRLKYSREVQFQQESRYLLRLCTQNSENPDIPPPTLSRYEKYTLISVEYILSGEASCTASSLKELTNRLSQYRPDCRPEQQSVILHGELISWKNTFIPDRSWIAPYERGYLVFLHSDVSDLNEELNNFMQDRMELRIAVSDTADSLSAIRRSFLTLENCYYQYFYDESYSSVIISKSWPLDMTIQYEPLDIESVASHMIDYHLDEAINALHKIGVQMRNRRYALSLVEAYVNLLITRLALFMDEVFLSSHELYLLGEKLKGAIRYMRLKDLLFILEQTLHLVHNSMLNAGKEADMGVIKEVISYVKDKYQEKITLKTVAEHFFINSAYLGQLFRRKMYISFNDYLTQLRMDKAKQLLLTTPKSISEISMEIGFDDPNYFSSRFNKTEGMTPREYRMKGIWSASK